MNTLSRSTAPSKAKPAGGHRPTWAVVATVDEPPVLLAAFVRHHLAIGAREVHIYLDTPNPTGCEMIAGLDGCHVTLCDDAYWTASSRGKKPPRHTARQKINAEHAKQRSTCDWILHCDADEFVCDGDTILADIHSASEQAVIVRNFERVYAPDYSFCGPSAQIFDGLFRQPIGLFEEVGEHYFAPYHTFLKMGFSGHIGGKSLIPVKMDCEMGVHRAHERNTGRRVPFKDGASLFYHFDGLTPLHFLLKILKRGYETPQGPKRKMGTQRVLQARFAREFARDTEKIRDFTRGVKGLSTAQLDFYRGFQSIEEVPFFPKGCEDLDFSSEAFDAEIRRTHATFFEKAGLRYFGD